MSSKTGSTTESCFVIMPFGGPRDRYYNDVYAPAISEAGIRPRRADEISSAGSVLQNIVELLSQCSVSSLPTSRRPTATSTTSLDWRMPWASPRFSSHRRR